MQQAPTSGVHGSAEGDVAANATSFARHLRAANKSPMTINSYLEATAQFDAFLADAWDASRRCRDPSRRGVTDVDGLVRARSRLASLRPAPAYLRHRRGRDLPCWRHRRAGLTLTRRLARAANQRVRRRSTRWPPRGRTSSAAPWPCSITPTWSAS